MKKMIHEIISDTRANPRLRKQVGELRGSMVVQAEKTKLPTRFSVRPSLSQPSMIITDSTTKKFTVVGLFAYGAVRQVLHELFD